MSQHYSYTEGIVYKQTIHDAITASVAVADAKAELCAGAKSIMLSLTEGGTVNNRSGELKIYVSNDGTNFYQYNMLIDNVANTNAQNKTRISSKVRASAGTDILFLDKETLGAIAFFKAELVITDGAAPTGNFTIKSTVMY
ncbi:hypothetical protein M0R01_04430 [bacterium]|jgi:hypothetical protein|nr:hypothetical protein [bacterium]